MNNPSRVKKTPPLANFKWWQRGIIYQVYPRSFTDSDGDGVGDLAGIRSKLDYLQWLGVDAIWISPIYPSPMADFGYDISNYTDIDPIFGTLDDFDALLADAHGRGLKVLLDYVPNHTSDQHPWFLASRSSRGSAKRD
jgi:alpha-glucosidase